MEEQVVTLPRGVPDETTHEVNDPAGSLFIQDLGSFTVQPTQQEESVLGQQDVTPHRVDVPDNIIYEKVQAATSIGARPDSSTPLGIAIPKNPVIRLVSFTGVVLSGTRLRIARLL